MKLHRLLLIVFFTTMLVSVTFSQNYMMSVENINQTDTTYEFDVTITKTVSDFYLSSYQCSFNFNNAVANGGKLTFSYIPGSSELLNSPTYSIGVNTLDGNMEMAFASAAFPLEKITSVKKTVGRFRLHNSVSFGKYPFGLKWCFNGNSCTVVLNGKYQDITTKISHTINTNSFTPSGNIILAAANCILGNGAALKDQVGSMGSKVAYCPTNRAYLRFKLKITDAGNYYIWGRFFYEGKEGDPNAFNLKLDGQAPKIFGNNNDYFNVWHWSGDGNVQSGTNIKLALGYLTAGTHDLVFSGREVGPTVMIDQVVVTSNSDFIPTDANFRLIKSINNNAEENTVETPTDFSLMQNYPNPFNPTTTIRYSLKSNSFVALKIYDILGNEVQTLVNGEMEAGMHEVIFNGENLASGMYIYVIKAANFTASKKLMLMK